MNAPLTPSTLSPAASTDWPATAVPESWIDSLFARMSGMYGSKFADMWRGTDLVVVRKLWGTELASLTRDELRRGVEALRTRPFPPTLPEFVGLCQPPVNVDAALSEAVAQLHARQQGTDVWSDPAIYWAAVKVGTAEMMSLSHSQLRPRFEAMLRDIKAKGNVPPVPTRVDALPAPGGAEISRDEARRRLADLKASGIVRRGPQGDERDWARRILAKVQAGQPVPVCMHEMAKRGLAAKAYTVEAA